MTTTQPKCALCGEPMPAGEEMFKFHGFSGPCPIPNRAKSPDPDRVPIKPGYYWAKWRIPAEGTHEGELQTPSDTWEIVQVNANSVDWERDPTEDEALSVSVPGVGETQWRDCFVWGDFVSPLKGKRMEANMAE